MSRRVHRAPLAVASDGTVLVNATEFDGEKTEELLEIAVRERGRVFIGVELEPEEVKRILARGEDGLAEAAARVVGARQRKLPASGRRAERT
jgi:hypothetical protein